MKPEGTTITRSCTYCGAMVTRRIPPSHLHRIPENVYCNREHRHLSMAREGGKTPRKIWMIKFPHLHDPHWLKQALSTHTPREVAEQIGCSHEAVRKAAKRNGIEWVRK